MENNQEQPISSVEGQPFVNTMPMISQSASAEKMAEVTGQYQSNEAVKELNWLHNKLWATGWKGFTCLESERGALAFHNAYNQLKAAPNHLEELEKWVKDSLYVDKLVIIKMIKQLKQ